jgi:hypothetical protein
MERFSQLRSLKSKPQQATDRRHADLVVLQIRTPIPVGTVDSEEMDEEFLAKLSALYIQTPTEEGDFEFSATKAVSEPEASSSILAGRPRDRQLKRCTAAAQLVKSIFNSLSRNYRLPRPSHMSHLWSDFANLEYSRDSSIILENS